MFNSTAPSVADIAAVMGNNGCSNGWGYGGDWWIIIILLALFGGFGNYGANGNGTYSEVQRGFDTQAITSKLNGLEQGLCSLGYDQLAQINGINNNVLTTGFGIQNSLQAMGVANMQNANDISRQLSDCCCENRSAIAQVRYDMATNTCAINSAITQAAQTIVQNANDNYRALHDEMVQARMDEKDRTIADLTARLNNCDRNSELHNLGTYIVNSINPPPRPAYVVSNPYVPFIPNFMGAQAVQNDSCGRCCQ